MDSIQTEKRTPQTQEGKMDSYIANHLEQWANREFSEDSEREHVIELLTDLWNSDTEHWERVTASWWAMLDIARKNETDRAEQALRRICKS